MLEVDCRMELHYSQTIESVNPLGNSFYYRMELHYSQTNTVGMCLKLMFYYRMELHYSQTSNLNLRINATTTSVFHR